MLTRELKCEWMVHGMMWHFVRLRQLIIPSWDQHPVPHAPMMFSANNTLCLWVCFSNCDFTVNEHTYITPWSLTATHQGHQLKLRRWYSAENLRLILSIGSVRATMGCVELVIRIAVMLNTNIQLPPLRPSGFVLLLAHQPHLGAQNGVERIPNSPSSRRHNVAAPFLWEACENLTYVS